MKLQKIIAIGGGDFRKYKTLSIDTEIVRLSAQKEPHFLFIPTASSDHEGYVDSMREYFQKLGCTFDTLYLIKNKPSAYEIAHKISSADIIYVGGGNTLKMMTLWRKLGVDTLLAQARRRGAVLCGTSAGSICWFNYGNSDSRKDKNPDADYIKVTALGFIDAFHCPHYDTEADRKASLKKMMRAYAGVAIALEDCAALQIVGDEYRVLVSNDTARAYKVYWKDGQFYEDEIEVGAEFRPLEELLKK